MEMLIIPMTFGEYLKEECGRRGLETADFARLVGVSWARADRMLNDLPKRQDGSAPTPRIETIKKVASIFKTTPDYISKIISNELAYEPADDEEELLSFYRGIPSTMRPSAKEILRTMMEQAQIANESKAIGHRTTDED